MIVSPNADERSLWPDRAYVGDIVYPPGGHYGPRVQLYLQLVIIHSGEMTVWIDGEPKHATANTVALLFPGHDERFAFSETCETHHSWLAVQAPHLSEGLLARLQRIEWPLPLSPTMNQLIREALSVQATTFPTAHEMLKALTVQMLWRYIGEGEQRLLRSTAQIHPLVEKAQSYIHEHLSEVLTLDTIAGEVALSPAYLIRLFRTYLHTTPMEYLWQCRVAKGVELLEQTGLSVHTIAEHCGFVSRYHFSRRVRDLVGYTPQEVRRRSWQHPKEE